MKIENGTMKSVLPLEARMKKTGTAAAADAAHQAKPVAAAFNVEISSNVDEISRDRVAAIRAQLAAGTYNISGKDVANKILGVLKE